jgi:hypothetical protein
MTKNSNKKRIPACPGFVTQAGMNVYQFDI